jgi:hypothetical protein
MNGIKPRKKWGDINIQREKKIKHSQRAREKETGERVFNPAYFLTTIFFSFLNIFGSKGDFSVWT